MEKEYEGFTKAVRLIMQAAEKNTLRGVHGPVANLMTTDKRYAVAIEIAPRRGCRMGRGSRGGRQERHQL